MGHGEVSHQAVAAQHLRHHLEASWADRCGLEDEVAGLQRLEGKLVQLGEEANVRKIFRCRFQVFDCFASSGSLLTRNLADLVKKEHFTLDSEYLTTLLVVVPK